MEWLTELAETKGDVTRDDWQRRFLAQHSVKMLKQYCNYSKQCRNNVATMLLCCVKNRSQSEESSVVLTLEDANEILTFAAE